MHNLELSFIDRDLLNNWIYCSILRLNRDIQKTRKKKLPCCITSTFSALIFSLHFPISIFIGNVYVNSNWCRDIIDPYRCVESNANLGFQIIKGFVPSFECCCDRNHFHVFLVRAIKNSFQFWKIKKRKRKEKFSLHYKD